MNAIRPNRSAAGGRNPPGLTGHKRAFTLIELLVVIAIIGILAAILLPALARGKMLAKSATCLGNLKQLELCWHLYAGDNDDVLPPNNFLYNIDTGQPLDNGASWCANVAPYDANPAGITNGVLFEYNRSLALYHCPADTSTVESTDPAAAGKLRLRSYSMSESINGAQDNNPYVLWTPSYVKFTDIPKPSQIFTFLDVHEDEILDVQYGMPFWPGANTWWDVPANRHNQGCNFAFADGHAEHWRWQVPKQVTVPHGYEQPVPPEEMADFQRVQSGLRQDFN